MRKNLPLLLLLLVLLPVLALAQKVVVPRNVTFADIRIRISDGAQRAIQEKVDALHRNQTYFNNRVELADAYFPLIERTFKEEGVPEDLKYLALQESGLIGDAVSTSNAVGYWQFKKEAASDFNLRMDNQIDERKHIVEASRGAARYFKRSNAYYDNWFNTVLSYYLGPTGAKAATKASDIGSKKMEVTEKTHTYLLTFLAHKIAYENFVGKRPVPTITLSEIRATPGQSLLDIALETQIDAGELEKYNKWLLGNKIPTGKEYYVMVPVRNGQDNGLLASKGPYSGAGSRLATASATSIIKLHGLNALIARKGDTKEELASQANISTRRFLKYNDLYSFDDVKEGGVYYTEPKRTTAAEAYHVVQPGENMHMVAQHHGIKLKYLLYYNRMDRTEAPVPGRVLWLQSRRPARTPVEIRDLKQHKIASGTTTKAQQPASHVKMQRQENATKENFFTRLINSLKNKLEQPTPEPVPMEVPVEEEAEPAVKEPETKVAAKPETKPAKIATENTDAKEPVSSTADTTTTTDAPNPGAPATAVATLPATKPQAPTDKHLAGPAPTQVPASAPAQAAQPAAAPVADSTIFEVKRNNNPIADSIFKTEVASEVPEVATVPQQQEPATTQLPSAAAADTAWLKVPGEDPFVKSGPERAPQPEPEHGTDVFTEPKQAQDTEPVQANAPAQAPTPAMAPAKHTVKQGETLYSISREYAVSIHDLSKWNNLGDTPIKIGQVLLIAEPQVIPAEEEAAVSPVPQPVHTHLVAPGETLYQLSKKYNVPVNQLRDWNSLTENSLSIGQELRVTAPEEAEATPVQEKPTAPTTSRSSSYHTVATGESLYQISRQYDITIKDIMEWNNKSDFSVRVGEKLLVRKK